MDTVIAAPASCEVRAVIRFLHAEGQSAAALCPSAKNSVKKIHLRSQNTYRTAGGSGDDSVHVLSVFTPTLRGENV